MTDIPFLVITLIYGLAFGLMAFAYIYRTSFPMSFIWFMVGSLSLIIFVTTDNITLEFFANGQEDNTVSYPQDQFTGLIDISAGATASDIRGEYVFSTSSQLYGDTIDCIEIPLRKLGSPTGTATIGVYDHAQAVNNPIIKEFGTIDVTTLNGVVSIWYTFCLADGDTYTIGNQDVLGVRYDGGDTSNAVRIDITSADVFDSSVSELSSKADATNVWSNIATNDLTAIFYLRGEDATIEPVNYELRNPITFEPTFVGLIFIMLSLSFVMVGILIEKYA